MKKVWVCVLKGEKREMLDGRREEGMKKVCVRRRRREKCLIKVEKKE